MNDEDSHREFVLSALRAACLRAKLFEIDVNSIGVALKGGMISVHEALEWAKDIGALESMGVIPAEISNRIKADMIERTE